MYQDDFDLFEGKKKKKIKPVRLKIGRRVVQYSKIDKWLKSVQELIKDLEELSLAKKKAELRMKAIKEKDNTKSQKENDKDKEEEKKL